MSKRTKSKPQERGYVLFDVLYEDGSRASNRRVPVSVLGGLEGDEPARRVIEEQDEAIAARSSACHAVPAPLMRTRTGKSVKSTLTFARAASLGLVRN